MHFYIEHMVSALSTNTDKTMCFDSFFDYQNSRYNIFILGASKNAVSNLSYITSHQSTCILFLSNPNSLNLSDFELFLISTM